MSKGAGLLVLLILAILATCDGFTQENPSDRRILVLLEDLKLESSNSVFFKSLSDRGYELEFKLATDPQLALQKYGEYLYDALVVFAPSAKKFGGSIDLQAVLDFVDSGHDLILAGSKSTSTFIRNIAAECGVSFSEDVVIDHLNYDVAGDENDHTLLAVSNIIQSQVIVGPSPIEAPVLFRGVGLAVTPGSTRVVKVLSASDSAYAANPNAELLGPPLSSGKSIGLVSVIQARNNARIMVSGSLDMFSDKFIESSVQVSGSSDKHVKSGNKQFVSELSKWVFHERGHLKAVNLRHHKLGEVEEPAMYRITDHLDFSVEIYEWTGKDWQPYQADDVQVQFYMMSPYVLKTLDNDGKGKYGTSFQVPDVYGVFQFKVDYRRLGYTTLDLSKQIPVRPYRHNEYERFIEAAYPYYGGAFSMMAGFFVFGLAFLYHK